MNMDSYVVCSSYWMYAASPSHCLTMKRVGEFKQRAAAAPASPSPPRSPVSPLPHNLVDPRLNIMKHQRARRTFLNSNLYFRRKNPHHSLPSYNIQYLYNSFRFLWRQVVEAPSLFTPQPLPFCGRAKLRKAIWIISVHFQKIWIRQVWG